MKNNIWLIYGIVALFIGMAIQPGIATVQSEEEINKIPKEFLFYTIINIMENKDVQEIFFQNDDELINFNYNLKDPFFKILKMCSRIITSTLSIKPKLTTDYLEFIYNNGCKIVNTIGKHDSLKIIESVKFSSTEILEKIKDVTDDNYELNANFLKLTEMNNKLKQDLPFDKYPIICAIIFIILVSTIILFWFYNMLLGILSIFLPKIMEVLWFFSILFYESILMCFMVTLIQFECIEFYWYPPI